MSTEAKKKKKPYRPPQVRSERLVVADLFTPTPGGGGCIPDPETGVC